MNYSNLSTDDLNKLKAQNSQSWWDLENSQADNYKQQQDDLHQQNLDIVAELDKRNNTTTTYNSRQGTYNSTGNQALDTSSSSSLYNSANNALSSNLANKPTDKSTKYDPMLDDLYNQIVNRDKFSYDLNADALYQQYADQYTRNGQLAMQDTMGQTAALTGGYGSTYSQMAGQQAYNSYLQQLNDIVPELEQRAYDRYRDEGNDLLTQWNLLDDRLNTEYGKYTDALNDYWTGNNFYANRADQYYNQMQTEYGNAASEAKNLMSLGYSITDAQGKALGMTADQVAKYNDSLNTPTYTGTYSPSNDSTSGRTVSLDTLQNSIDNVKSNLKQSGQGDQIKSSVISILGDAIKNGKIDVQNNMSDNSWAQKVMSENGITMNDLVKWSNNN